MNQESDGSSYLAALKRESMPNSAAVAAPAPDGPVSASPEKRQSQRYKCNCSAEICVEGTGIRTWATCRDISLHGCYLEVPTTHPVGTVLQMKIEADNFRIFSQGNVRVTYPHLGMGIAFTSMAEADRTRLKDMLKAIIRPSMIMGVAPVPKHAEPVPNISDPKTALTALIAFFDHHQTLNRNEFIRLLRGSQSSASGAQN